MQIIFILFALLLISCTQANLSGPYLLWGNEKVINLQPRALIEANENDFADLFRDVKAIVVFVRNNTKRLDGKLYPKFQELVKHNAWTYLPQRSLAVDPFDYNANIEVSYYDIKYYSYRVDGVFQFEGYQFKRFLRRK